MKVAHIAIATPGRCGLYETTRELVVGERLEGVDARIIDPKPIEQFAPKGDRDRGAPLADWEFATSADVVVSHSGHDGTPVSKTEQPIIHVAHGRPLSTFLGERNGGAPGYSYQVKRSQEPRYKACVTFWSEHEPYLRNLWKQKPVVVVPPPVDLEAWKPERTEYDFEGKAGGYNVVMTDPWSRVDVSPFPAIHAFALFRSIVPDAKLHMYAVDANRKGLAALLSALGDGVGLVKGWETNLRDVYRAADMLITPHKIYTRSIRESMASGLQVVTGRDADPENPEAFAWKMAERRELPQPTRGIAEALFDPRETARKFMGIVSGVMREKQDEPVAV